MDSVKLFLGLLVLSIIILISIVYLAQNTVSKINGYWVGPDGSTIYKMTAVDTALSKYQNAGFTVRGNGKSVNGKLGGIPGNRNIKIYDDDNNVIYNGTVDWDLRGFRSPDGDWIKQGI